ncbi:hypothetical protein SAMN05421788_113114 [Filimonas lacunae]|uniref:Uncharacterized protein n=1 Tax=Filimonas lacunae TaxID=477680 RepID=A0A173MBS5_9BACT|nr:hypothetical protein [Filimonas lacunae]BAV04931.1 hypothetical protein FLA_0932 [Filimonas lacunae]SIT33772.1 hypothetical protein SAMN05421788_113114 [Filimonas lacunae]
MKYSILLFTALTAITLGMVGCSKKVDTVDTYYITVNFNNSGAKYLTGNIEVNPKDSIYFDFTVHSDKEDMDIIEIQKNGVKFDTMQVRGADKRNFAGVKKYMADSAAGDNSYRIAARNAAGKFLGYGGKIIKVTTKPDFNYYTYRFLYVPDSVNKTNKCYFASSTGMAYNYTEATTNSALIDFGYYYDTSNSTSSNPPKFTIYAPSVSLFDPYDLSSWTRNATTFKLSTTNFTSTLTSLSAIKAAYNAGTNPASPNRFRTSDRPSGSRTNLTGAVIMFKTAAGKYGAINVNFTADSLSRKESYINIDVKVEK